MASLASCVGERPCWPIKKPEQRKRESGLEAREIRAILLILDLKEDKL